MLDKFFHLMDDAKSLDGCPQQKQNVVPLFFRLICLIDKVKNEVCSHLSLIHIFTVVIDIPSQGTLD